MPDWLIDWLGIPWYSYIWPMVMFGLMIFYLLLFALRQLSKWLSWIPQRAWQHWLIALPLAFVAVSWDIWWISREANRLCRAEGGLHIYKTVEADGFIGSTSINYWSQYGFKYVEGYGFRATLRDGKPHKERVGLDNYKSHYAVNTKTRVPIGNGFYRSRYWMKDVRTGEVLGELVTFTGPRGWTDNYLPGLFEGSPWGCGHRVPPELQDKHGKRYGSLQVILETVIPTKNKGEVRDEDS